MSLIHFSAVARPVDSAFADASRWVITDDGVVYNPQDHSYKEVLLGGTPIEWFFTEDEVPTVACATPVMHPWKLPKSTKTVTDNTPSYDFIETETHIIRDGSWPFMNRDQLMEIPWIAHSMYFPESSFTVNSDQTPLKIVDISPAGGMEFECCIGRYYILKNKKKDMQLKLVNFALDADGWMLPEKIAHSEYIETVNWSCDDDAFVYYYDARGKMQIYHDSNCWDYRHSDDYYDNYYDDQYDDYSNIRHQFGPEEYD